MRKIKKPKPTNDPVNPTWVKPFSRKSIRVIIKFSPILQSINAEDVARDMMSLETSKRIWQAGQAGQAGAVDGRRLMV
jgi:hypothetical protein